MKYAIYYLFLTTTFFNCSLLHPRNENLWVGVFRQYMK